MSRPQLIRNFTSTAGRDLFKCVIMGPPGSGKGTVSERILKHFPMSHVSCGEKLRYHIKQKTELGKEAIEYMRKGQLVPDELATKIMTQEIARMSDLNVLLDGFPRTVTQAQTLTNEQPVDYMIRLDVPFEEIVERLTKRWVHAASGRIYNLDFNPPIEKGLDDVTKEPLTQREDDKPETVIARLKSFDKNEQPVADFYSSMGRLETFKGRTTAEIWPKVFKFLSTQIEPTKPFKSYKK